MPEELQLRNLSETTLNAYLGRDHRSRLACLQLGNLRSSRPYRSSRKGDTSTFLPVRDSEVVLHRLSPESFLLFHTRSAGLFSLMSIINRNRTQHRSGAGSL